MDVIGTIRTFKTANFTVIVDAMEERYPDISFDETDETKNKLESGEWIAFCARVRVLHNGHELAQSYLGNCIHSSIEEFEDHRECAAQQRKLRAEGSTAVVGSYFVQMVKEAIDEARDALRHMQTVKIRANA